MAQPLFWAGVTGLFRRDRSATKLLALAILLLTTASNAAEAWKEPEDFRGLKFNENLETQMQKCPYSMEWFGKQPYPQMCWVLFRDTYFIDNVQPIAGAKIALYAFQSDKRLGGIRGTFKASAFATISNVFMERYGAPTSAKESTWMSKGGVKLPNTILEWKGEIVSIQLKKLGSRINQSEFTFITKSFKDSSATKEKDKIKDAAKGL